MGLGPRAVPCCSFQSLDSPLGTGHPHPVPCPGRSAAVGPSQDACRRPQQGPGGRQAPSAGGPEPALRRHSRQSPGPCRKLSGPAAPCHPHPLTHTGVSAGQEAGWEPRATTCRPPPQPLRPLHLRKGLKLLNIYPSKVDPWLPAACRFQKKTNRGKPGGRSSSWAGSGSLGAVPRLPAESTPDLRGGWGACQGGQGHTARSHRASS